jgi:hypothetical protein
MPEEPKKGELNQQFGFYVEREFHIESMMPKRRYIDIIEGNKMVIKTSNSYASQVWYFSQKTKTIVNKKYSNRSFDIANAGRTNKMQIWNTNSGWF